MLSEPAAGVVHGYLARLDDNAPGLVDGFYVVGSIALGSFRPGRSDIDFVATTPGPLSPEALAALRSLHRRSYAEGAVRAVISRSWPLVCNGVFVNGEDLARPTAQVTAEAHQVSEKFAAGDSFDVNPVTWWTLAHHGIALRGPSPDRLTIHLNDDELRRWTAVNLVSYWRPWAHAVTGRGVRGWRERFRHLHSRRLAAWGVLGTARMHATISTGEVVSKERRARPGREFCSLLHRGRPEGLRLDHRHQSSRRCAATRAATSSTVRPASTSMILSWSDVASAAMCVLKSSSRARRFSRALGGSLVSSGIVQVVPRLSSAARRKAGLGISHTAWSGRVSSGTTSLGSNRKPSTSTTRS